MDREKRRLTDDQIFMMVVNEYKSRQSNAKEGNNEPQMVRLAEYELNALPGVATGEKAHGYVFFEVARIINDRAIPAGPLISEAPFYMLTQPGNDEVMFVETSRIRQLLLDSSNQRIIRSCYGGRSVFHPIPRQLLLDVCIR